MHSLYRDPLGMKPPDYRLKILRPVLRARVAGAALVMSFLQAFGLHHHRMCYKYSSSALHDDSVLLLWAKIEALIVTKCFSPGFLF